MSSWLIFLSPPEGSGAGAGAGFGAPPIPASSRSTSSWLIVRLLGSGSGVSSGWGAPPDAPLDTSFSRPRLLSSSLARDTLITFMNSLSSAFSILRKKRTTTT